MPKIQQGTYCSKGIGHQSLVSLLEAFLLIVASTEGPAFTAGLQLRA